MSRFWENCISVDFGLKWVGGGAKSTIELKEVKPM